MERLGIFLIIFAMSALIGFQHSEAAKNDYYRTYEIIEISENGLTLQDSDGNIVETSGKPEKYKVGYKVRYDRIRKRLKLNRWQDYTVSAVDGDLLTLLHTSGDILTVKKNYMDIFSIGDSVRYDSISRKLKAGTEPAK